ncbi:MAG: hypothetical protein ACREIT_06065 [Tepidisphaeraceae bacterium]
MSCVCCRRTCVTVVCLLSIIGCDRGEAPTTAPSASAISPASPGAAPALSSKPAPTASVLMIEGLQTSFPGAKARVQHTATGVSIAVFSDDSADVAAPNGYSFEMPLDVEDIADVESAVWVFKHADGEEDPAEVTGIFLDGGATRLRPLEAKATFERNVNLLIVHLRGDFSADAPHDPGVKSQVFPVEGRLVAELVVEASATTGPDPFAP